MRVFDAMSQQLDTLLYDATLVKYSYMIRSARGSHLDKVEDIVKYDRPFGLK